MKSIPFKTTALILILHIGLLACSSKKTESNKPFNPVGDWKYKVTTDVSYGVISIKAVNQGYAASMTTEVFGTLELMNLQIKDKELMADLDVAGTPAKITCTFSSDDKMKGAVRTSDTEFPFIGERSDD